MRGHFRVRALGAVVALSAGLVAFAGPAEATIVTVTSGSTKVIFLDPNLDPVTDRQTPGVSDYLSSANRGPYEDNGILNELNALLGTAAPGSTVYGSIYTVTSTSLRDSIKAATAAPQRSDVYLTIEMCPESVCAVSTVVQDLLDADADATGYPGLHITQCVKSCYGSDGIDHNKFWVFSALTDGRTDVVVQSSYNATTSQKQMFNNLVEVSGNATLATGYRAYWARLAAKATPYETGDLDAGTVRVWFFPRNVGSAAENAEIAAVWGATTYTDLVAAAIADVNCAAGGGRIDVAMWDFKNNRSQIIDALATQATAGCTVTVATGEHQEATKTLGDRGVGVYGMSPGGCRNSWFVQDGTDRECADGSIHSKFLLVSGVSRKDGQQHAYAYTGSENYTNGALVANDEALMRLSDGTVVTGFQAEFDRIITAAKQISPSLYPNAVLATVNSVSTGNQQEAATAAYVDGAGHHVVYVAYDSDSTVAGQDEIWLARYVDGVRAFDVRVRGPYAATGGPLCQTSGTTGSWSYRNPAVGVDSAGNAVVAWEDDNNGNGYYDIDACRVTPAGTVQKAAYRVNSQNDGQQTAPAISVLPDGRYGVVWEDVSEAIAPGTKTVRYAAFSATDARLTALGANSYDVSIAGGTTGTYVAPDVSVNPSGQAVVAWSDDSDGNAVYNVRAKTDTIAGTFAASSFQVNVDAPTGQQDRPAVAMTSTGAWVAVWQGEHGCAADERTRQLVCVRRYVSGSTSGFGPTFASGPFYRYADGATAPVQPLETADVSGKTGPQSDPDVAVDGAGNAVVTWTEAPGSAGVAQYASGLDVWARGIDPNGTFTSGFVPVRFAENRLSVWSANDQFQPSVAMTGDGIFSVAYADDWDGNGGTQLRLRTGFTG